MADQVHFGRSSLRWPIWITLADLVNFGGPHWPIKSTCLKSTWPSNFETNSGGAKLSHRTDFISSLLQDPEPLDNVHGYAEANSSTCINKHSALPKYRLHVLVRTSGIFNS